MDSRTIFEKYLSGTLTDDELKFFENWILRSENRQDVLNFIESEYFKENSVAEVTPFVTFMEKLQKEKSGDTKVVLFRQKWFWAACAAAVFFILIGAWIGYNLDSFQGGYSNPVAINTAETNKGQVTKLTLSDGSRVILAGNSSLSFPDKITTNSVLYLEGEAYFDLMPSREKIKIKTKDFTTTTTNSKINIRSFENDSTVNIAVEEGKAEVKRNNNEAPLMKLTIPKRDSSSADADSNSKSTKRVTIRPAIKLNAKEQVTYDKNSDNTKLSDVTENQIPLLLLYPANHAQDLTKEQTVITFKNASISEITSMLHSRYQLEFEVNVSDQKLMTYSGNFNARENPLNILMVVCQKLGLQYSIDKNQIKISSK